MITLGKNEFVGYYTREMAIADLHARIAAQEAPKKQRLRKDFGVDTSYIDDGYLSDECYNLLETLSGEALEEARARVCRQANEHGSLAHDYVGKLPVDAAIVQDVINEQSE